MKKIISIICLVVVVFSFQMRLVSGEDGIRWTIPGESDPSRREPPPPPAVPTEHSRTLYKGYVDFDKITLEEIMKRLESFGCNGEGSRCHYFPLEGSPEAEGQRAIIVLPMGPGWGPLSFALTAGRLYAIKDIPGSPDENKYKEEVRKDLAEVGTLVVLNENSWKIIEAIYPWDVQYSPGNGGGSAKELLDLIKKTSKQKGKSMIGLSAASLATIFVISLLLLRRRKRSG